MTLTLIVLLSNDQELRIVRWILRQEKLGFAPSQSAVREIVSSLANIQAGKAWVGRSRGRFIKRHIHSKIGRRQEAARFHKFTPKAVN
jgi:DNA-binding NarL/FixJ family response regulator